MYKEQEEIEYSRKGHEKECLSGIEECAGQQHNESIVEQTDTNSSSEQHRKCLDEW